MTCNTCNTCNGFSYLMTAPSTCSAGGERVTCPVCAPKVASDTGSDQCRPTLREVMSGGEPRAWDSDDERRGWYAGYDAAVDEAKRNVASDTGAGLVTVEDGANSHVFDQRIMHDGECIAFANEPWASKIAAGLATTTDATDGATGGGERTWNGIRIAPQGKVETVLLSATTTGGDLLEQAASACRNIAENSFLTLDEYDSRVRHEGIIAGARECERAIRALSARNLTEGGEK